MTTKLDVRPMLAAGEEPFSTIMSVVDGMSEGERFELVAPFDPVPLYEVLGPRGFHHRTEKRGPGEYVVEFVQTGITAESTVREVLDRHPATAELLAEAGFDACCGGVHALEHAARAHGKNLGELLRRLQAAVVASA
jgi:uncharacterized protein (DUF2249 family)